MNFEKALKAMREGKKVKRPVQFVPRTMKNGRIVELNKKCVELENIYKGGRYE